MFFKRLSNFHNLLYQKLEQQDQKEILAFFCFVVYFAQITSVLVSTLPFPTENSILYYFLRAIVFF